MRALIICESMFGNTRSAADAVAEGMRSVGAAVEVLDVAAAPTVLPDGLDLLLVGGPTHAFSMSRPTTRADAMKQRGTPGETEKITIGLREWVDGVTGVAARILTFETRVKKAFVPGSAAKSATKALKRRGLGADQGETFWVGGTPGPLEQGELDRARQWGVTLATG